MAESVNQSIPRPAGLPWQRISLVLTTLPIAWCVVAVMIYIGTNTRFIPFVLLQVLIPFWLAYVVATVALTHDILRGRWTVLTAIAMPVVWLSVWLMLYATGLHRQPAGWLWTSLFYIVPTFGLVVAVAHRGNWPNAIILLGVFSLLISLSLGILSSVMVPINHTRLDAELDSLDLLPAAEVVSWQESGGPLCVTRCPRVANLYLVPGDATGVATALRDQLQRLGYDVGSYSPPGWYKGVAEAVVAGHHGDISVDCWIFPLRRRNTTDVDPDRPAGESSVLAECSAKTYVPDYF